MALRARLAQPLRWVPAGARGSRRARVGWIARRCPGTRQPQRGRVAYPACDDGDEGDGE